MANKPDQITGEPEDDFPIYYRGRAKDIETDSGINLQEKLNDMEQFEKTHHHSPDDIDTTPEKQFISQEEKDKYAKGPLYSNTTQTVIEVGGIQPGSTFAENTVQEIFEKLLYPTLPPRVTITNKSELDVYNTAGSAFAPLVLKIDMQATTYDINTINLVLNGTVVQNIPCEYKIETGIQSYTFNTYTPTAAGLLEVKVYDTEKQVASDSIQIYSMSNIKEEFVIDGAAVWTNTLLRESPIVGEFIDESFGVADTFAKSGNMRITIYSDRVKDSSNIKEVLFNSINIVEMCTIENKTFESAQSPYNKGVVITFPTSRIEGKNSLKITWDL